jgi:hypothetical protein
MASPDTGIDTEKDGSTVAEQTRGAYGLAGLETGLDALDSAQSGRTPLRETLLRIVVRIAAVRALVSVDAAAEVARAATVGPIRAARSASRSPRPCPPWAQARTRQSAQPSSRSSTIPTPWPGRYGPAPPPLCPPQTPTWPCRPSPTPSPT